MTRPSVVAAALLAMAFAMPAHADLTPTKRVEFTGVVQGPGERGDFIIISGNRIYLDKLQTGNRNGQRATVTGWLRHFRPPTAAECAGGCENADVPEHYWIEDARFTTSAAPQ